MTIMKRLPLIIIPLLLIFAVGCVKEDKVYSEKRSLEEFQKPIMLHYGEGIKGIDIAERELNEMDYPTIALPDGPPGQIELFIGNQTKGTYTQGDLDNRILRDDVIRLYDKYSQEMPSSEANSSLEIKDLEDGCFTIKREPPDPDGLHIPFQIVCPFVNLPRDFGKE